MKKKIVVLVALLAALLPTSVFAHCDTLDGPVVSAANKALDTGNVNYALVWVQPQDEKYVREAFEKARTTGNRVEFYETLVKVHREGEGAEYTGLKPAGQQELIVQLTDQAIAANNASIVTTPLTAALTHTIEERVAEVDERSHYATQDIEAGREYIASYVSLMHYVEGVDTSIHSASHDHGETHHDKSDGAVLGLAALGITGAAAGALMWRWKK